MKTGSGAGEPDASGMPIDETVLADWALAYLGRFASSAENLRRVLMRRVRRRYGTDRAEVQALMPAIDGLVARFRGAGLLDDDAYATGAARSLHRRGDSKRAIAARLHAKGVAPPIVRTALDRLADGDGDPDLAAALRFARRRRLGPYRVRDGDPARELAAFARAGFSRAIAERILACPDPDTAAALCP
jgi:regulatory protein